jgi:hypothetical protein
MTSGRRRHRRRAARHRDAEGSAWSSVQTPLVQEQFPVLRHQFAKPQASAMDARLDGPERRLGRVGNLP